jgi:hypothetical protein
MMAEPGFHMPVMVTLVHMDKSGNAAPDSEAIVSAYKDKYVFDLDTQCPYQYNGVYYERKNWDEVCSDISSELRTQGYSGFPSKLRADIKSGLSANTLSKTMGRYSCDKILFSDNVVDLPSCKTSPPSPDVWATDCIHTSSRAPDTAPPGVEYLKKLIRTDADMDVLMECIGCYLFDRRRRFSPILYLHGDGGSGKSTLGTILTYLLGSRSTWCMLSQMDKDFNDFMAGKDLLIIDEITLGAISSKAMNLLKNLTAPGGMLINGKYSKPYQIHASDKPMILMFSNSPPAFRFDTGVERRFRVIKTASIRLDDDTHSAWMSPAFADWLAHEALRAFLRISESGVLSTNGITEMLMDTADRGHVSLYMDSIGRYTRDQVRDLLLGTGEAFTPPPTQKELRKAVQEFETSELGSRYESTATSIRRELVESYDIIWNRNLGKWTDYASLPPSLLPKGIAPPAPGPASDASAEDVLARYRRQWDEAGAETCMDMDSSAFTKRELDLLMSEGLIYSPSFGRYAFGVRQ